MYDRAPPCSFSLYSYSSWYYNSRPHGHSRYCKHTCVCLERYDVRVRVYLCVWGVGGGVWGCVNVCVGGGECGVHVCVGVCMCLCVCDCDCVCVCVTVTVCG
jgi:hypothetical protein